MLVLNNNVIEVRKMKVVELDKYKQGKIYSNKKKHFTSENKSHAELLSEAFKALDKLNKSNDFPNIR